MKKLILAISTLFALNLSALDFADVLRDIYNEQDYKTCLEQEYSLEFCKFAREYVIMIENMVYLNKNGYSENEINSYKKRALSRYICSAYRNMSNIDKSLLEELHYKELPNNIKKDNFDAMCY